jgi:hypothetical protein
MLLMNLLRVSLCLLSWLSLFSAGVFAADGQLVLKVIDRDTNQPTTCRMHLKNAQGKSITKVKDAITHGDYLIFHDAVTLRLPLGHYFFTMDQGPETLVRTGKFEIQRFADDQHTVDLKRFAKLAEEGWYAGDLDAARPVSELPLLMQAENLTLLEATTWNNEQSYWAKGNPPPKLPTQPIAEHSGHRLINLMAGQDQRAGTGLILTHLREPLTLAAKNQPWPTLTSTATTTQKANGYAHVITPFARELPLLIAAGKVDSLMVLNRHQLREGVVDQEMGGRPRDRTLFPTPWGNGRWALQIYYHLLNVGLHMPMTAGSGSGSNTNPLGYNRVYAWVEGEVTYEKWWQAVKLGRTFVTNGPLLRCSIGGEKPGHIFQGEPNQTLELMTELTLSTRDKIDYLEIIKDGNIEHEVRIDDFKKAGGKLPPIKFTASGWCLVRAVTNDNKTLRYASTAPFYVEFQYQPRISRKSVEFFRTWVNDELKLIEAQPASESQAGQLAQWQRAREYWDKLLAKANAE